MSDLIKLTQDSDHVVRITLNAPDTLNALTWEMGEAFESAVTAINARPEVRVVLLCGEGRAFSSGGNMAFIKENCARSPAGNEALMVQFYKKFLSVATIEVPTIAVIHGPAVGAGLAFSLACDIRLASTDAKLGVNFTRIGLTPGMGSSFFLPRIVGVAHAADLFYSGRLLKGDEAKAIGLVHQVYPTSEALFSAAQTLAETLSQNAPLALQGTKRLLQADPALLDAALLREAKEQAIAFTTEDIREGVASIEEKRSPRFTGA